MNVTEVRDLLAHVTPGQTFTLSDTTLGIAAVQTLFDDYLPAKTLTVANATADAAALVVTGTLSLPPAADGLPVTVTFSNDGTNVTGIHIRVAMPGWRIDTSFLQLAPTYLQEFGFKTLYLLLVASIPTTAAYGVGADFDFTSGNSHQTLALEALLKTDPQADYRLEGAFSGVTLADLNALAQFAEGGDFNLIPPGVVPLAKELELTALRVVVSRDRHAVLVTSIDVQLASSWKLIPGRFEFDEVGATFMVIMPNTVSATLFTEFLAFGISFQARISVPALVLEAALTEPVQFSKVLAQYLPDSDLPDLTIDYLRFRLDLRSQGYSIQVSTTENWTIVESVALTGLFFTIGGQGTSAPSGAVNATFDIGGTGVLVGASYAGSGAGWEFEGQTIAGTVIDAGQLVADVLQKFGVQAPAAVGQLTISSLAVQFNTVGRDFQFTCTGLFPLVDENVSITVTIALDYDETAKEFDKKFDGSLVIKSKNDPAKSYRFDVIFDADPTSTLLTLQYSGTVPLDMRDIVSGVGLPGFAPPPGLDLSLTAASFSYDFTKKQLVLTTKSVHYGNASFVSVRAGSSSGYFFALAVNQTLDLSNLPLIDEVLSGGDTVELEQLQFSISSATIAAADPSIGTINGLINAAGSGFPQIPVTGVSSGVGLSMVFRAGDWQTPLSVATGANSSGATSLPATAAAPVQSSGGTTWFNLQKTFGPVTFQKIGVRYHDGVLDLLMNASLSAGGLTIGVMGLGAGSKLTTFDLQFTISGIAIAFDAGPATISGALAGTLDPLNFYGELALGFAKVQIAALGGYAEIAGKPSFFLYAVLDDPIGGPLFFFVTGLAAGFGYNRTLVLPGVSGVATFPLVQWASGSGNPPPMNPGGDISLQVSQVLTTLQTTGVVAPRVGDDWFAAGVMFTSFEIVSSFALLTVSFGTKFEIAVLGLSTLVIPPDSSSPVAQVQVELEASFAPDTGLLAIAGQLTPQSYVLSQACHLTGGFAFYLWFTGPHAGEVVLTIGGYNPNFTVPADYPRVPRLGLNWQVDGALSITGQLYFALTANVVMAGGKLSAVWGSGPISAWFTVWADFLMVFKPFHYYLDAGIDLGASFSIHLLFIRITITIHVGVSIEIWGPEFAGQATVDLSIISFTIGFGSSTKRTDTAIPWLEFVNTLLPSQAASPQNALSPHTPGAAPAAPPAVLQINVARGLLKALAAINGQPAYLVSGETFLCSITSAIPIKGAPAFTGPVTMAPDAQQPHDEHGNVIQPNETFGAGPAGIQPGDFQPALTIAVATQSDSEFEAVRLLHNAPKALWENKSFDPNSGVPQADPATALTAPTLTNTLNGLSLVPTVQPPDHTLPVPLPALEFNLDAVIPFDWSNAPFPLSDSFQTQTVASTITVPAVANVRTALLAAIVQQGIAIATAVEVASLSNPGNDDLLAPPRLRLLGEQQSAA